MDTLNKISIALGMNLITSNDSADDTIITNSKRITPLINLLTEDEMDILNELINSYLKSRNRSDN